MKAAKTKQCCKSSRGTKAGPPPVQSYEVQWELPEKKNEAYFGKRSYRY